MSTFNFSKAEAGHSKHARDSVAKKKQETEANATRSFHGPPASVLRTRPSFLFFKKNSFGNMPSFLWAYQMGRGVRVKSGNPFSPPRTHVSVSEPPPPSPRVAASDSTPSTNLLPTLNLGTLHDFQVAGCGGGAARGLRGRASASAPAAPTCQLPVHSLFSSYYLAPPATIRPRTNSAAVSSRAVIMAAQGSLVAWRAVFAALGVLMVGTLVYTCATDGSPFRSELLTP